MKTLAWLQQSLSRKQPQPADLRFAQINTLVVKVTNRCNLDCLYCYENIQKKGQDMSMEVFVALAERVFQGTQAPEVLFLFHGGEPMLLPAAWYEQACAAARKIAKRLGKRAKFAMQSNLVSLTPAKITMLRDLHIELGISFDGIAERFASMRNQEAKVMENYWRLREANVKTGILTTINHQNFAHFDTICRFLVKEAKVNHFKANVVSSVGRGYGLANLSATQIFEAQRAIFEFMIETQGKVLTEYNLCLALNRFFDPSKRSATTTLCHEKRCGAGSQVLGITTTGDLLPCGRFQWDDHTYHLGNLTENDQANTFKQKVDRFHDLVPQNWFDCPTCPAKAICAFGCQAFIVRSQAQANVECLPTKMLFQYLTENQERLRPIWENGQQARSKPQAGFKVKDKLGNYRYYQIQET